MSTASVTCEAPSHSDPERGARKALLLAAPSELGSQWAGVWFETLRAEGRSIDGGWPGTLPEARARVQEHLDRVLAMHRLPLLTVDELNALTTATYQSARSDWTTAVRANRPGLQGSGG